MPRRRSRQPSDLTQLRRVLWRTIVEVEALLDVRPPVTELVLKAAHCLAQLSMAYTKILDETNIHNRLTRIEQRLALERVSPNGKY